MHNNKTNVTRDPRHNLAHDIYAPNFKDLTIKVDGQVIENARVRDAYVVQGYVNVFNRVNGKIVDPSDVTRIDGRVEIIGQVKGCTSCSLRKRMVNNWHHRVGDGRFNW